MVNLFYSGKGKVIKVFTPDNNDHVENLKEGVYNDSPKNGILKKNKF